LENIQLFYTQGDRRTVFRSEFECGRVYRSVARKRRNAARKLDAREIVAALRFQFGGSLQTKNRAV
jgi:hypothetical protein